MPSSANNSDSHSATPATASTPQGEPYVALRKDELIELLVAQGEMDSAVAQGFRRLCALINTVLHQEFHARQEYLKNAYAPFDPDTDTRPLSHATSLPRDELVGDFLDGLCDVLTAAHYRPLQQADLDYALSGATYWGLDLQINREIFDRLLIYVRGASAVSRVQRDVSTWFKPRIVDLEIYQRLVLVVKLRSDFMPSDGVDTHNVYLKMFREIPKLDLEMLLPGTRPRIRLLDAGKIGGSSVTGIYSLVKMALEYAIAGKLKWLMLGVGTLAYALQSFLGYRRTKAAYVYSMTQQLYYQNLDNNAGVFCRLIDEAEDEETKETILAYFFLWHRSGEEWTPSRLAESISSLVRRQTGDDYQFEARAAISKLERLGLLTNDPNRLQAIEPRDALAKLRDRWGAYITGEFHDERPRDNVATHSDGS